ncbi:MAG: PAS domain-containing protein [Fimbriimonadales bacterium]
MFFNVGSSSGASSVESAGPSSAARKLSLSQREEEILILSSQGLTDRQIAVELDIRLGTINTHWSRIRLKLGASTRSQAVAILLRTQAEEESKQLQKQRDALAQELREKDLALASLGQLTHAANAALQALPVVLWAVEEPDKLVALVGKLVDELGLVEANDSVKTQFVLGLSRSEDLQRAMDGRIGVSEGAYAERRFETHLGPWPTEDGRRRVVGLSIDATLAKATQDTLLASLKLLTSIVEASPSVIHVHDADEMREVYVNRRVFHTLGYSPKEIYDLGSNITLSLVHPEDVERVQRIKQEVLQLRDGEVMPVQYRMRRSTGEYVLVSDQVTVLSRHPDGRVKTVLGIAQVSQTGEAGPSS